MPSFTEHGAETTAVLGKPFEEVYRRLDEFAAKPPYGMRHRNLSRRSRCGERGSCAFTLQALNRCANYGAAKLPQKLSGVQACSRIRTAQRSLG